MLTQTYSSKNSPTQVVPPCYGNTRFAYLYKSGVLHRFVAFAQWIPSMLVENAYPFGNVVDVPVATKICPFHAISIATPNNDFDPTTPDHDLPS